MGSDGEKVWANFKLLSQKTAFFGGLKRFGGKEMGQMQSLSHFSGKALQLMVDFLTRGSFFLDSCAVLEELMEAATFYGIPELELKIESDVFFENHPQVIRPSSWAAWVRGLNIEIHTVTDEEAYTALSKGRNIEAMLGSRCCIYGKSKTLEEKRMYVYIPQGFTLTSLGAIFRWESPPGAECFRSIWDSILEAMKGQATVGGWVEMTKDVIPESRSQTYAKQLEMIEALNGGGDCYQVPTTLEALACCLAWYFEHQERLFSDCPWTHTRCQEQVRGYQVTVGGFLSEGLSVQCFGYDGDNFGVAAMRKLS